MSKIVKTVVEVGIGIGLMALSGGLAGIGIAGVMSAGTLASAVTGLGLGLALMGAETLVTKTPSMSNSLADRLSLNYDTTAPRAIVFGTTAADTALRFKETYGKDNDRLALVIANASHKLSAVKAIYLDSVLSYSGGLTGKYANGIERLQPVLEGTATNGSSTGTGSYWTSRSTFTGCAYTFLTYKLDKNKVWTDGLPQKITTVVNGCPVYDPRRDSTSGGSGTMRPDDQSTWAFTAGGVDIGRNPALALLTYIIGYRINGILAWGMGVSLDRINIQNFIEYANICEEGITAADGSTIQRYTCDGIFSTNDSHETVINSICAAMGTTLLIDLEGLYQFIGGFDDTLTTPMAFTADDVMSGGVWSPSPSVRDRFNIVSGRFADPAQLYELDDWGSIEVDPLFDNIPRTQTVDLGCVDRAETCQRIAKQMLLREKYSGSFVAVFGPRAFGVGVGSLLTLSLPQYGWEEKLFRVTDQSEAYELLYQMTLREESPEIYAWDENEGKPLPGTVLTDVYDPIIAADVTDLAIEARSVNGTNSVSTIFIDVSWTPSSSLRVASIEIQSQVPGDADWTTEAERYDDVGSYTFAAGVDGAGVNVRARYRMSNGATGDWSNATLGSTPVSTVNQWSSIYDDGDGSKPEDGATKGAPSGTNVGSVPADQLVTDVADTKTALTGTDGQIVPIVTIQSNISDAQSDIADLFATYGNTASSASNANAAQTAADAAQGYSTTAQTAEENAEAAETAGKAAQTASETARDQAQRYATNADGSASSSAGFASAAQASKEDAAQSASAAQASQVSAQIGAAAVFPDRIDGTNGRFTYDDTGSPTAVLSATLSSGDYVPVSGYGTVARYAMSANHIIATVGAVPFVAGRTYRVEAELKIDALASGDSLSGVIYMRALDSNFAGLGYPQVVAVNLPDQNTHVLTSTFSCDFVGGDVDVLSSSYPGIAWLRPVIKGLSTNGSASSLLEYRRLTVTDITSELAAGGSAAAAASSASAASASQTAAGQNASTATTHANTATTQAGNASASATRAATSEGNAQGYANTASSQAGVAASSANTANSALAATFPRTINPNAFTSSYSTYSGAPVLTSNSMSSDGTVIEIHASGSSYGFGTFTLGLMPYTSGHVYKIHASVAWMAGASNLAASIIIQPFDANGNALAIVEAGNYTVTNLVQTAGQYVDASWTWDTNVHPAASGAAYLRFGVLVNRTTNGLTTAGADAVTRINALWPEDITESTNAANSASAAADSASTAATNASAAGTSASAVQASQVSANLAAASLLPSDFTEQGTYWANSFQGTPASRVGAANSPTVSFLTVSGLGPVAQCTPATLNTVFDIGAVGAMPVSPGRTYRLSGTYRSKTTPNGIQATVYLIGLAADYSYSGASNTPTTVTAPDTATHTITVTQTGDALIAAGCYFIRPLLRTAIAASGSLGGSLYWISGVLEDVTESTAAQGSASAAATSASQASTYKDDAGASATTATTQANTATSKATAAASSATAAVGSASTASTKASDAATSASSASTSATNANTYKGQAQTYAGQASSSADDAAASASSASSSSGTAATYKTQAGNSATAAAGSASDALASKNAAATSASTSTSQASIATAQAAAASSSAVLAASIGQGSLNGNPVFADWTSTLPSGWSASGGGYAKVAGVNSPNGFQVTVAANVNQYLVQDSIAGLAHVTTGSYVVEADILLNAGTFSGTIILFDALYGSTYQRTIIDLNAEFAGATTGNIYRLRKLITVTAPGVTAARFYIMTGYSPYGTVTAKTLVWYRASVRQASDAEIKTGQIDTLSASVTTQAGAIATLQGKTTAYLNEVAAAGSSSAAVQLVADGTTSGIELQADAIRLGSSKLPAMDVVGGDVHFYGKLQANSVLPSNLVSASGNLVSNGDIGTGDLTAWRVWSGTLGSQITVQAKGAGGVPSANINASYAVKYSYSGSAATMSIFTGDKAYSDVGSYDAAIPVTAGQTYTVSIDACKSAAYASTGFEVLCYWYVTDGVTPASYVAAIGDMRSSITTAWQTFSGSITIPAGVSRVSLYVYDVGHTNGDVYWTNLRLSPDYADAINSGSTTIDGGMLTAGTVVADRLLATTQIALGTSGNYWPVALASKDYLVSDGDAVTFGVDLGAIPQLDFSTNNLDPLTSGETYHLYADNLTSTGFTTRLRIIVPGTPSNYDLTTDRGGTTGEPTLVIDKGSNPDSSDGSYQITFTGNVWAYAQQTKVTPPIYRDSTTTAVFSIWVKKANAWSKISTYTASVASDSETYGISGNVNNFTNTQGYQFGSGVQSVGVSLDSWTNTNGTHGSAGVSGLTHLKWTAAGSSTSDISATSHGQTARVTVRPQ